ncbi:hypothetical protein HDU67_003428, partial [Dinochytrium kinnereticum]
EYMVQRYEGASTIYGPNTLNAYLDVFDEMMDSIVLGKKIQKGEPPEDLTAGAIRMLPPPIADSVPIGLKFGAVRENVPSKPIQKGETISASFWAGHPRNGVRG